MRFAAALAALCWAVPVWAGPAARATDPPEVAQGKKLAAKVQRYYARTKDFSANFAQTYDYLAFGRKEERTGKVQVKKPGLVRWEYETPEKKLLLLDGSAFWQWSPEDNQAIVSRNLTGTELSSAFTFLWGKGDLLAEFTAREVPLVDPLPHPAGARGLELLPRKPGGSSVQKLIFAVAKDGQVLASAVTDAQGNENRLVFKDARRDARLPEALFHFDPPKGASVQELGK